MSSKFSLATVVTGQLSTLTDARTGRYRWEDFVVLFAVPVGAGAGSYALGWHLSLVSEFIAAISIITGLLFGMIIFVFQLRLQLGDPEVVRRTPLVAVKLVDELFRNVAYAIVVGFVSVAVTLAGSALRPSSNSHATTEPTVGIVWTAVACTVITHFIFVLAMCLKRLVSAYAKIASG